MCASGDSNPRTRCLESQKATPWTSGDPVLNRYDTDQRGLRFGEPALLAAIRRDAHTRVPGHGVDQM